ncbi:MAG: phasin family protein [Qipengyuania sp.]|uniref:phasin family protein n=1 Tax=Qipengyuania sp. TaxID=2004515 RepID=UPI0030039375
MAESPSKIDAAATVSTTKVAQAVDGDQATPVNTAKVAEAVAKPAKAAPKKVAVKKAAPKKAVAKKAAPVKKPVAAPTSKAAPAKAAAAPTTPIPQLKETIMATAKTDTTTEYTAKAQELAADMQARVKSAYDKGTEMTKEAVAFQKGNLEALVESGKILASGIQDMGRTCVEEAKSVAETTQDDVKKFAAIKSPTEMFQLQGEIARRNFDAMVSTTSKNTETMLKLVNEAFAPMSNRMSLAAEKVGKAA